MRPALRFSCDIFCHVVDNYGDVGVTWRLARQLRREFDVSSRLFVDDLQGFTRIAGPRVEEGVTVAAWPSANDAMVSADVVIEAFGCTLPDFYVEAMAACASKPAWINLEYLSAERWVGESHLLPSPHPRLPLMKHFFFPGFDVSTGGLLRETDLFAWRDAYTRAVTNETCVFLFGYENAATRALLDAMDVEVTAPEGTAAAQYDGVIVQPFVPQSEFDRLLWNHDILFVRGEDSFVRAQWAAKPFVWQIYPQEEGAHWVKLNAFLDRYCDGLLDDAANALRELWRAWNAADKASIGLAWRQFLAHRETLARHARIWADKLAEMPDLATNLVTFLEKSAKI